MKSFVIFILFSLASSAVHGCGCGGSLEGDSGQVEFPVESYANDESSCLWIIQLVSKSGVYFTLNKIGPAGVLSLYPEHEATETILEPLRLDARSIDSTVLTTGQVLVVVLTKGSSSSGVEFTWESNATDKSPIISRSASYSSTPQGRVSFGPQERLTWALVADPSKTLTVNTKTNFSSCQGIDPCQCSHFALYQVTPQGHLEEVTRVCGRASESTTNQLYSQLVAFLHVDATASSAGSVEITWIPEESEVITKTITSIHTTTTYSGVTPQPPAIKLECGGIIDIPNEEFKTKAVEYKLDEYYGNNELCMWILNASLHNVGMVIVSEGFQTNFDGLEAYHVTKNSNQQTAVQRYLLNNSSRILSGGQVFIMFSSDGTTTGTGFKLRLISYGQSSGIKSSYFHLDDHIGSGSLKYPKSGNYSNSENLLAVLQLSPNTPNFLQLSTLQTAYSSDSVSFFQVFPVFMDREPYLDGRWYGTTKTGSLSYSVHPRIVTFISESTVTGTGFTFEWFSYPQEKCTFSAHSLLEATSKKLQ